MSFREMRNFTEMMRVLGFPRLISMENFRNPNFALVSEILYWLVMRYDSNADITRCIDTEQDRVIFIKTVAHFMATKAHIRLNTKKLYQADGYAVKELLKVTTLLYEAMRRNTRSDDTPDTSILDVFDMTRVKELKDSRVLASEITTGGAKLSDLLQREIDLREIRLAAIGRELSIPQVEVGVKSSIKGVHQDIAKIMQMLENIASDEANLEAKIDKKRNELGRNQKRLLTLQSVRPAYMDEYEQYEVELNDLYTRYLQKFRNLSFRETQYEELMKAEVDRHDDSEMTLRKMADQLREQEIVRLKQSGMISPTEEDDLQNLLDEDDEDDSSLDSDEDKEDNKDVEKGRPGERRGNRSNLDREASEKRVVGGMDDDDEEVSDLDSNEIDDEDDDDDDDDEEDDFEDDDEEINGEGGEFLDNQGLVDPRSRPGRPIGAGHKGRIKMSKNEDSDEDF